MTPRPTATKVAAVALVASNAPVAAMARDFGEAQAPPPTPAEVADAARGMHSMLLTGYGLSEHRQLLLADLREAPLTIVPPEPVSGPIPMNFVYTSLEWAQKQVLGVRVVRGALE